MFLKTVDEADNAGFKVKCTDAGQPLQPLCTAMHLNIQLQSFQQRAAPPLVLFVTVDHNTVAASKHLDLSTINYQAKFKITLFHLRSQTTGDCEQSFA